MTTTICGGGGEMEILGVAMRYYIGIDPGANGAVVILREDGNYLLQLESAKASEHDIAQCIRICTGDNVVAIIEKVHAMPKQGVSSTFKFGRSYGVMIGILTALGIPYREVTPQTWQKAMSCLSKGDKNVTKAAAQKLFPSVKVTHANADALLIAEYCRRTWV
jgi:crossover junction endodeoxyribonuclease RuvC